MSDCGQQWVTVGDRGQAWECHTAVTECHRWLRVTIGDKRPVWASVGRLRVMYRDFGKVGEVAYGGEGGCIKGVQW